MCDGCKGLWDAIVFSTHLLDLLLPLSLFSSLLFCSLCTLGPPLPPLPLLPSFPLAGFSLSLWVSVGAGTIRKAQNLLKQYSQHGLDGKKGGANLTPLEGKALQLPPSHTHTPHVACPVPVPIQLVSVLWFVVFCAFEKQHSGSHKHQCSFWIKLMQHSLLCRITVCEKMFEHVYHVYLLERRKFSNIVTKTPVEVQKQL